VRTLPDTSTAWLEANQCGALRHRFKQPSQFSAWFGDIENAYGYVTEVPLGFYIHGVVILWLLFAYEEQLYFPVVVLVSCAMLGVFVAVLSRGKEPPLGRKKKAT
jgi:hypothetical protein